LKPAKLYTEATEVNRRQFVKTAAAACIVKSVSPVLAQDSPQMPGMMFYIAGVRFNRVTVIPQPGCSLRLAWEDIGALTGCALFSSENQRLGYVPQLGLSKLKSFRKPVALLTEVDRYAIPWKRYKVLITEADLHA
jgi:hypothetical protein